jgi:hypothetical protein
MYKISIQIILVILSVIPGISQPSRTLYSEDPTDNFITLLEAQREFMYELYYHRVDSTDQLIDGKDYFPYYYRSELKPILFIDRMHTSSIIFKGREYKNVALDYDTFLDEVIYSDKTRIINNRIFSLSLNKDRVESFALDFGDDSLFFRHFRSGRGTVFNLPEGYYEVAYDGNSRYIIKHHSSVLEKEGSEEYFYTPENYIAVGDEYIRIRSARGFFRLFGSKSDEIRKFIRNNNVDISHADKRQIVNILKYYDSLIIAER